MRDANNEGLFGCSFRVSWSCLSVDICTQGPIYGEVHNSIIYTTNLYTCTNTTTNQWTILHFQYPFLNLKLAFIPSDPCHSHCLVSLLLISSYHTKQWKRSLQSHISSKEFCFPSVSFPLEAGRKQEWAWYFVLISCIVTPSLCSPTSHFKIIQHLQTCSNALSSIVLYKDPHLFFQEKFQNHKRRP